MRGRKKRGTKETEKRRAAKLPRGRGDKGRGTNVPRVHRRKERRVKREDGGKKVPVETINKGAEPKKGGGCDRQDMCT